MELTELAEHIAAIENDTTVEDLTKQQRKRVYVSLYQTHVPKMEDAGLVEYDEDTTVLRLQARADEVDDYLGTDNRFRWEFVYLLVAGLGFLLVALANTEVPLIGAVPSEVVAFVVLGALLLTALTHVFQWTR